MAKFRSTQHGTLAEALGSFSELIQQDPRSDGKQRSDIKTDSEGANKQKLLSTLYRTPAIFAGTSRKSGITVFFCVGERWSRTMEFKSFVEAARNDGQKIERLIRRFYSQLPLRDVFIDGGAHYGYHTSYAREFFSGRVISIEASPKTYVQHIKGQAKLTAGRPLCEVIPLNCALGCREKQGETVNFFFSETHPGRSTVNTKLWDSWAKGEVVYQAPISASVIEIDDVKKVLATDRRIDFIKLDLEGNEINALRGGHTVLRLDRPAIVMEFGIRPGNEHLYNDSCSAFVEMMRDFDYALYTPWAERAEQSIVSGYSFWYLFAFPQGQRTQLMSDLLSSCFEESMRESSTK